MIGCREEKRDIVGEGKYVKGDQGEHHLQQQRQHRSSNSRRNNMSRNDAWLIGAEGTDEDKLQRAKGQASKLKDAKREEGIDSER